MKNPVRFEKKQFIRWKSSWMVWISRCEIFRRNRTFRLSKISRSRFLAGPDRKMNCSNDLAYKIDSLTLIWIRIRAIMMQQNTDPIVQMDSEVMIIMKIASFWIFWYQIHFKSIHLKNDRWWFGFMVAVSCLDLVREMKYLNTRFDQQ